MATEKRLIDANAADVERIPCYYGDHCHTDDVQEWLNELPTVDAVEVMRCKDCKYRIFDEVIKEYFCNSLHSGFVYAKANDYCSYGERKLSDDH